MTDRYRIDSHKLIYHPGRVSRWQEAGDEWERAKSIYPIYVEISPIGICNHRCTFCALDYMEYQNRSLDPERLKMCLSDMAHKGVKSAMFAGEGEPTLYRELPAILDHCTASGIDSSLTTNMVPFTEQNTDNFVRNCKWIKVSINAGNAEQYAAVHRTKATDFQRVLENMKRCVAVKKEKGYSCTLGTQLLLIPENASSVTELARTVRDIGMDYLVIKPYSQHMYSQTHRYESVDYSRYFDLEKELRSLETDDFHIVFRMHTMEKLRSDEARYCRCLAVPYFWAYIDSGGDVYGCSAYLGAEDFNYGNIHDLRFPEIWEGEKRRKGLEYVRTKLDIRECRLNCRMDEVNRYLWDLKNPPAHANFI